MQQSMLRDDEALVDWNEPDDQPHKRPRGRPRKDLAATVDTDGQPTPKSVAATAAHKSAVDVRGASLIGGVNVTWLAQAWRIDSRTVRKRLAGLKPTGIGPQGTEIYDFVEAGSYLAPPQRDKFARWIGTLRTSDLPTQLQDSYWAAMRKRQIWEQNAAELWKTEDVLETLGEVLKMMKSTMQLWVDNIDKDGTMPEGQRKDLGQMVDGLQNELYHGLVEMPQQKRTLSSLYDPEIVTNNPQIEEDDDDEDMIG
jgi:hypothetical protein